MRLVVKHLLQISQSLFCCLYYVMFFENKYSVIVSTLQLKLFNWNMPSQNLTSRFWEQVFGYYAFLFSTVEL